MTAGYVIQIPAGQIDGSRCNIYADQCQGKHGLCKRRRSTPAGLAYVFLLGSTHTMPSEIAGSNEAHVPLQRRSMKYRVAMCQRSTSSRCGGQDLLVYSISCGVYESASRQIHKDHANSTQAPSELKQGTDVKA